MKKFFFLLISLAISAVFLAVIPGPTAKAVDARPGHIPGAQRMLNASVQLFLYSEDGKYADQGFGTLVEWKGMKLIVTHNHWHFLYKLGKARILNARNELLVELSANEFKNLVRYSDPGTLVLEAPKGLSGRPSNLAKVMNVRVGDIVTVAHQKTSDPSQIDLIQAEIRAIDTYKNKKVFRLVSIEDERIIQGDSGGGIWLDGQFVGNSWGVYVETEGNLWARRQTQITIAAQLPPGFLETLGMLQHRGPAVETGYSSHHPGTDEP